MLIIPTLRRARQEDCYKLEASLGHIDRSCCFSCELSDVPARFLESSIMDCNPSEP